MDYDKLGYDLIKDAFSVYTGEDTANKKEQVEKYLTHLEGVSGASLKGLPVLVNTRQPWRNFMRYYMPRTLKQVPGKVFKGLATVAEAPFAPLLAGTGVPPWYHLQQAMAQTQTQPGEYYQDDVNTVNITNPNLRESLAHEVGHWLDKERGVRTVPYGPKHSYYDKTIVGELNAALMALRAAKTDKERGKFNRSAGKALSTYLIHSIIPDEVADQYDKLTGYKHDLDKETKKLPKGWYMKQVTKGLQSPSFKNRSRAALLALMRLHNTVDASKWLDSASKDWQRHLPKRYIDLAQRILTAEYEAYTKTQS